MTLSGPQISEGARGLKLRFSVLSTLPHLVSSANTVRYEQYEPQASIPGILCLVLTPATTLATVYQSFSLTVQPVF